MTKILPFQEKYQYIFDVLFKTLSHKTIDPILLKNDTAHNKSTNFYFSAQRGVKFSIK